MELKQPLPTGMTVARYVHALADKKDAHTYEGAKVPSTFPSYGAKLANAPLLAVIAENLAEPDGGVLTTVLQEAGFTDPYLKCIHTHLLALWSN